jgi:SAM-dependent methyltransferase
LLFPARDAQLSLLLELAAEPPARILDCASGTGEYVAALAARGYEAQGIELDTAMHQRAIARHPELASNFILGDMVTADRLVDGLYNLTYCIGNSLSHLASEAEVASALKAMWELTRPDGVLLLQIANYENVLKHGYQAPVPGEIRIAGRKNPPGFAFDLPELTARREDGARIELTRRYMLRRAADLSDPQRLPEKLVFHTRLEVDGHWQEAFTPLLILTCERLKYCLPREANREWYGGFGGQDWSEEEKATVVVLR